MVAKPQSYPRISIAQDREEGLLDLSLLHPLPAKIELPILRDLIARSIHFASKKASQKALKIESGLSEAHIEKICTDGAKDLFKYFKRSDPASIFNVVLGKNCKEFASDLFRKRAGHNATMNAGWRYQYLFVECAQHSGRFRSVSDVGTGDSDVNLTIDLTGHGASPLSLFISMKNRLDTISGSKWGGAIEKLEALAKNDKNKTGAYCCIFALGMHKRPHRTMMPKYSSNTEIWPANVIWPFVSGYTYEEIMSEVAKVLQQDPTPEMTLPHSFLMQFEKLCKNSGLVDDNGVFDSETKLIKWLCS